MHVVLEILEERVRGVFLLFVLLLPPVGDCKAPLAAESCAFIPFWSWLCDTLLFLLSSFSTESRRIVARRRLLAKILRAAASHCWMFATVSGLWQVPLQLLGSVSVCLLR